MDYFRNSYRYEWRNTDDIGQLPLYRNAALEETVTFSVPKLFCLGAVNNGSWSDLFQVNVKTKIYRQEAKKVEFLETGVYRYEPIGTTRTLFLSFDSGPTAITAANNALYYSGTGGITAYLRTIRSSFEYDQPARAGSWEDYYEATAGMISRVSSDNVDKIIFTIPALTIAEIEAGKGYIYTIECIANPPSPNSMIKGYEATHEGWFTQDITQIRFNWNIRGSNSGGWVDPNDFKVTTAFWQQDFDVLTQGGYLIAKGSNYSCYKLLRKALLTVDTHILDNTTESLDEYNHLGQPMASLQHPIVLDPADTELIERLTKTNIHETIFENKNLWEILIAVGYYLHAIPYLEFATDGTDRFYLRFKQLGGTKVKENTSTKITVFNSRNLSDFFTQYDSYVTNLFSPQNLVEEWVTVKTSDSAFLVSNNTAELHLSYGITELIGFDISMKLPSGKWETKEAIGHVFEKSIYDILSSENPYRVWPCKGSALHFSLGDNKIQGLNFVPPSVNEGDMPMALKRILQILWQGTPIGDISKIKFNDLVFRVKYKTQDSARITQIRPDLLNFMKNSKFEMYPHHEQYFGQQDKIVDSERFSANLWGKLIRVGNGIYQCQEYATPVNEKESGDLVTFPNGESYYVTSVDNEYYCDAIFQKVTYSKNFNQLSQIVTIPSEPRFYEVSERSKIRREVRILEFLELSTEDGGVQEPKFLNNSKWKEFIKNLLLNTNPVELPNYVWSSFRVDKLRLHKDSKDFTIPNNQMFPSSLIDRTNPNEIVPSDPSDRSDCIVPLQHFPLRDGIVFEWDMDDNFKARDFIDDHIYYDTQKPPTTDKAYLTQQPYRYVDVFGRAELFKFKLFSRVEGELDDETFENIQKLPQAVLNVLEEDSIAYVKGGDNAAIALEKDNREALSFNYQISLLHRANEGGDFLTYPNLFGQKSARLKACILFESQSMFNESLDFSDSVDINYSFDDGEYSIGIRFEEPANWNIPDEKGVTLAIKCKAIALYDITEGNKTAYIAKNVSKLEDSSKLNSWWLYPVLNS